MLGIAAGKWLDLASHGVKLIGMITFDLRTPSLPQISNAEWVQLAEIGLGLAHPVCRILRLDPQLCHQAW